VTSGDVVASALLCEAEAVLGRVEDVDLKAAVRVTLTSGCEGAMRGAWTTRNRRGGAVAKM
jgi:hypothetical protein